MKPVIVETVQKELTRFANQDVYIHLETTSGAYPSHFDEKVFNYRIGLKLPIGWIYAEGITHFEVDEHDRLLLAGHDYQGKLAVCLEISLTPFS